MKLSLGQLADICNGTLVDPETASVTVSGATIDSREITEGQLFVPLIAERDGHDFIANAAAGGAAATLISHGVAALTLPAVRVADTAVALRDLGIWASRTLQGRGVTIVGVTGSVGKTSVKDLAVAAMTTKHAHANLRSFNNELGVPLTLLATPDDAEVVVLEMGARGIGHIAELCAIARPDVGIVTAVGAVHTSEFGSIDAVAIAKGELVEALEPDGTAVLNAEDLLVSAMAHRTEATVVRYGDGGDVWASDVEIDDELRPRFVVHHGDETATVQLSVSGLHQVSNALAAIAAARACGIGLDAAAQGLSRAELSPWRMEMHRNDQGAVIINDAYNANPLSMRAALDALAALDASSRVAVLGTMAELGDRHDDDHRAIAEYAATRSIRVIAFEEPAYGIAGSDAVSSIDEVCDLLGVPAGDSAILVKGSRVAGLERLADALVAMPLG